MFRFIAATALSAAMIAAVSLPASAESVDASAFSCKELTDSLNSTDKETQYGAVVILSWMAGYNATEDQGTVVDFDTLKKDGNKVVDFCASNPNIGVMTAAAKFMGENATAVTKEAIDLAVIKCGAIANDPNPTDADAEGAGVVLMWLAGYYASAEEETMIDLDALGKSGEEIGKTCGENENMGLVTAARKVLQIE